MILLFSGGIDSFVAYHYLDKPKTVYFDLNTPYSDKEIKTIKKLIPSTIIDKSLSLGDRQIGEKAYIPFRNLYLAMLAVKYSNDVVIVGIKDDLVSDKNKDIFEEFSDLLSKLEQRSIKVLSPFWDLTKYQIVKWYLENIRDNKLLDTVSCYSEIGGNYCGECSSCFRKWNAFVSNGIPIDFYNNELMGEYYQAALDGKYIKERNESIIGAIDAYRS